MPVPLARQPGARLGVVDRLKRQYRADMQPSPVSANTRVFVHGSCAHTVTRSNLNVVGPDVVLSLDDPHFKLSSNLTLSAAVQRVPVAERATLQAGNAFSHLQGIRGSFVLHPSADLPGGAQRHYMCERARPSQRSRLLRRQAEAEQPALRM